MIVGATEVIHVEEAGLDYQARIDTGARLTSLHAVDLAVEEEDENYIKNIGKVVTFKTVNERSEVKSLRLPIVDSVRVSNAQGSEYRYVVRMDLSWKGHHKQIDINLRDRSGMNFKLLIGRDWLRGDFLVNVDL